MDQVKAPKISVSEIQDEGTFDQSHDDEFVWAMRSFSALTEEHDKECSIEFKDSDSQSKSECTDIRSFLQMGDTLLKCSKTESEDNYSVKILSHKVCFNI